MKGEVLLEDSREVLLKDSMQGKVLLEDSTEVLLKDSMHGEVLLEDSMEAEVLLGGFTEVEEAAAKTPQSAMEC